MSSGCFSLPIARHGRLRRASLKGAIVAMRDDSDEAYCGKEVSPTDILIRHQVTNPKSKELVDAVANAAGAQ